MNEMNRVEVSKQARRDIQKKYRDRVSALPGYKARDARRKRDERERKKKYDPKWKKTYKNILAAARNRKARKKQRLKKINLKRRKDGLPCLSLECFEQQETQVSANQSRPRKRTLPPKKQGIRRSQRLQNNEDEVDALISNDIPLTESNACTTNVSAASSNASPPSEISGEKLTVDFGFHKKAIKRVKAKLRAQKETAQRLQREVWKLQKKVPHKIIDKSKVDNADSAIMIGNITSAAMTDPNPSLEANQSGNSTLEFPIDNTNPNQLARDFLMSDGISPEKAPNTLKYLELGVAILGDIKQSTPERKAELAKHLLQGKRVKRGRKRSFLAKHIGVHRQTGQKKDKPIKSKQEIIFEDLEGKVLQFMKRPDNSVCMPGKKDTVTIKKQKYQKYILNDYLHVLHRKYNNETMTSKVSLSFFQRVRCKFPYIKLVGHKTMMSCLCKSHENMRLLLKAVPQMPFHSTPDVFIAETTIVQAKDHLETSITTHTVQYLEWCIVDVKFKGKTKKRTRRVEKELPKDKFITMFINSMQRFASHVERVIAQYKAVHNLKDNLPQNHITIQMDFAENWTVHGDAEIQSAYFAKDQITIHPAVVHYKVDGKLQHKSYVVVSDERSHSAPTVFAFLKKLLPNVCCDLEPDVTVKHVHYITDSPSSQYRNIHMFSVLANHKELLGTEATWLYLEAGHGKGPCDGVGGTSKRLADDRIRRGGSILTPDEYVEYGNSSGKVKYLLVKQNVVEQCRVDLESISSNKSIKGTMLYHAAVCNRPGELHFRQTSCTMACCLENGKFILGCHGWKMHTIIAPVRKNEVQPEIEHQNEGQNEMPRENKNECVISVGNFIVAVYDTEWYIGQVIREEVDGCVLVRYMHPILGKLGRFKWPSPEDMCETPLEDIFIQDMPPLMTSGTRNRVTYILEQDLVCRIVEEHKEHIK